MKISRNTVLGYLNWGIAGTYVLFQFMMQAVAGIMARQWRVDFHLTSLEVSNLSAAFFYTFLFMQIPAGIIFDRFQTKWVLFSAALLLSYASYTMSMSTSYMEALNARVLMGVASPFGFIGMLYLISQWFHPRLFATMVALAECLIMLAVGISEIGVSYLVMHIGWRMTMYYAATSMLLLSLMTFIFVRDRRHTPKKKKALPAWATLCYLIKQRAVLSYSFYGFVMFSLINVFASLWGIPFLRNQYHGMDLTQAATLISMFYIGVALGSPCMAWFMSQYHNRQSIMVGCALITAGLFILLLVIPSIPLVGLYGLFFLTAFFSSTYILSFDFTKNAVPKKMQSVCVALTNMIIMLSAPVLQLLVGSALNHGWSYPESLSVLPVLIVIASVLIMLGRNKTVKRSL